MKSPLRKPRTDHSFKSFINEPEAVGKVLRERLSGNFPGVVPDTPLKPIWRCDAINCTRWSDPNSGAAGGDCAGWCAIG